MSHECDFKDFGYEEEGIVAGKFPTMSWSRDAYSNWLSQNALNVGLGVVTGVAEALVNPVSRTNYFRYYIKANDRSTICA